MSKPIRVLQVVTQMNRGGLETMLMNYYRNIDKSKVQFDFLTHRPENEKKDYDDEILGLGGKIFHIRRLNPFSPQYYKELRLFFKNHPEYKIIHVHQDCLSSIILKVALDCGVSVRIAHCHSSNQDKNIKYLIKVFSKRFIKHYATDMISCSEASGKWMFGEKTKFTVLPNAIDTEQFSFSSVIRTQMRANLGYCDSDIVIGNVGRFCKVKNHSFMIEICKSIHNMNPNYKMIFVGSGELLEQIKAKAEASNLLKDIKFCGMRSDVPDLLQAMDIFILPSLYEGTPVSVIEAQTSGLKCFISDKVPSDCILSDLVKQLPLESSAEEWANEIMESSIEKRRSYKSAIANAGYDIGRNAKSLEKYYILKYGHGELK